LGKLGKFVEKEIELKMVMVDEFILCGEIYFIIEAK